jgi:hypothetical protein
VLLVELGSALDCDWMQDRWSQTRKWHKWTIAALTALASVIPSRVAKTVYKKGKQQDA